MPSSEFPRRGYPLVPMLLKPVLSFELTEDLKRKCPDTVRRLCDLDETIWSWAENSLVAELYGVVSHSLNEIKLPCSILSAKVPWPEELGDIGELELQVRTIGLLHRYIRKNSFSHHSEFREVNLGRLLNEKGFGYRSLLDLLSSLEHFSKQRGSFVKHASSGQINGTAEVTSESGYLAGFPTEAYSGETTLSLAKQFGFVAESDAGRPRAADSDAPVIALRELFGQARLGNLERELNDFARFYTKNEKNHRIVVARYGLDGKGRRTLEQASEGLTTRENVRQVCAKFEKQIRRAKPELTVLRTVISLVTDLLPVTDKAIQDRLQATGFISSNFDLTGLTHIARVLEIEMPFEAQCFREQAILVEQADGQVFSRANSVFLNELTRGSGVTSFQVLCERLRADQIQPQGWSNDKLLSILKEIPDIQWLGENSDWFSLHSRRSILLTVIRKILAVSPTISWSHLISGARRSHRVRNLQVPDEVIKSLARKNFLLQEQEDGVLLNETLLISEVLSPHEQHVYATLVQLGGKADRESIERRLAALEIPRSSMYSYLRYSPILARVERGVYCLRGASGSPDEERFDLDDEFEEDVIELDEDESNENEWFDSGFPGTGNLPYYTDLILQPIEPVVDMEVLFDDHRRRVEQFTTSRDGQGQFRSALLELYSGRCAVSGCEVTAILEAAHIIPFLGTQSNILSNGIILRCDIHALFDLELLAFEPTTGVVRIHHSLMRSEYACYDGLQASFPKSITVAPKESALLFRFLRFSKDKARISEPAEFGKRF